MSAIVDIIGREILDSRGNPTVECDVLLRVRCNGSSCRIHQVHLLAHVKRLNLRDGDNGHVT
jgi:enolase